MVGTINGFYKAEVMWRQRSWPALSQWRLRSSAHLDDAGGSLSFAQGASMPVQPNTSQFYQGPPGHVPDGEIRWQLALLPCVSRPPRQRPRPRYWQKPAAMPRSEQQLRRCRARHDTRQMRRAAQRQKRCRRG